MSYLSPDRFLGSGNDMIRSVIFVACRQSVTTIYAIGSIDLGEPGELPG